MFKNGVGLAGFSATAVAGFSANAVGSTAASMRFASARPNDMLRAVRGPVISPVLELQESMASAHGAFSNPIRDLMTSLRGIDGASLESGLPRLSVYDFTPLRARLDELVASRHLVDAPLGILRFIDTAPVVALAAREDGAEDFDAVVEQRGPETPASELVEVELQTVIRCSACNSLLVAEGVRLSASEGTVKFECGIALCPSCVELDEDAAVPLLAAPELFGIDGGGEGDRRARGVLRVVRRSR